MEEKDHHFDEELGNKSIPEEKETQSKTLGQTKTSEKFVNSNNIDVTTSLHEDPVAVFENPQDKANFLKRVYSILTIHTISVFVIVRIITYYKAIFTPFLVKMGWFQLIPMFIIILTIHFTLHCSIAYARKFPLNCILLGLHTLSLAAIISIYSLFNDATYVLVLLIMFVAIIISLTAYLFINNQLIAMREGLFLCLSIGLICGIIIGLHFGLKPIGVIVAITVVSAMPVIFGLNITYSTVQMVEKNIYELQTDDYVLGVVWLILDF